MVCVALEAAYTGQRVKVESGNVTREIERQSIASLIRRKDELRRRLIRLGGDPSVPAGSHVKIGVPTP